MAQRFEITGTAALRKALGQAGDLATQALAAAMLEEQSAIMSESQTRVPVDTGVLRASGTVLPPKVSGTRVEVEAGYGGAAAAYAIVQHEKHSSKSKFLERPFLERVPKIPGNLARKVEAAWRRLAT